MGMPSEQLTLMKLPEYWRRVISIAPNNLVAYYPLWDPAGVSVVNLAALLGMPAARGDAVTNGGFAADTAGWTLANSAVLSSVAGGQAGNCLQIENGTAAAGKATQTLTTLPNGSYTLLGYQKNGSYSGAIRLGSTGVASYDIYSGAANNADWGLFSIPFVAVNATTYLSLGVGNSTSGNTTLFDTISVVGPLPNATSSGVTLGQPGIGDGKNSMYFDGSTDVVKIHSAALASAFNGGELTLLAWMRMANATAWTDSNYHYVAMLQVDDNNYVYLRKANTDNTLTWAYNAGGTLEAVTTTAYGGRLDWICMALTASKTAELMTAYANGATVNTSATLGNWAGSLVAAKTVIGANSETPTSVFLGNLGHCALWNKAFNPAEVAYVSRLR